MTDKDTEGLIRLIATGKNTRLDIKNYLPRITDDDLSYITFTISSPERPVECLPYVDYELRLQYEFSDTDKFELTELGHNLLHKLQKEDLAKQRHADSMKLNKKIYLATIIGIIIGATSVLISLLKQ